METENNYQKKYLKYKNKYEDLKQIVGGHVAATHMAMSNAKHRDSSTTNNDSKSKSNANVKVVGRNPAMHDYNMENQVELYCERSKTYYSFDKNVIYKAKDEAFKENAPNAKTVIKSWMGNTNNYAMVDNEGNGLLNKLLNNLLDPKEHKNYFEENSWMENSVVIGFRSEDDGTNPKLNQPVFYALDKQFFWQFEPEKNIDTWFNVTPITIKEKSDDVITKFVITDGFYVFKWSGFFGGEMEIFTEGGANQHTTPTKSVKDTISDKNYNLDTTIMEKAKIKAFNKYGVREMLNYPNGLLNKLLTPLFWSDSKENQENYFKEEEWMKTSYVVGLRSENFDGSQTDPSQPVFYSPAKNFFWQFETSRIKPGKWINNIPNLDANSNILVMDEVYSFKWSGGDQALNAVEKTGEVVGTAALATGAVVADMALRGERHHLNNEVAGNVFGWGHHPRRDGLLIGGVRLDNLLPDSNLVNPPQIGGSEKI